MSSLKAFVSSTFTDLQAHRRRVIGTLRGSSLHVDPMENWTATSSEPKEFSQERMKGCDVCILLVAFRKGYVPDGETLSITQMEYRCAVELGIPVLVFLLVQRYVDARDPKLRAAPRSKADVVVEFQDEDGL